MASKKSMKKAEGVIGNTFVVSDGDLVLHMTKDEGKWYCVTAPFHEGVVTQARSIEEAFEMARDAIACLAEARIELERRKNVALRAG